MKIEIRIGAVSISVEGEDITAENHKELIAEMMVNAKDAFDFMFEPQINVSLDS